MNYFNNQRSAIDHVRPTRPEDFLPQKFLLRQKPYFTFWIKGRGENSNTEIFFGGVSCDTSRKPQHPKDRIIGFNLDQKSYQGKPFSWDDLCDSSYPVLILPSADPNWTEVRRLKFHSLGIFADAEWRVIFTPTRRRGYYETPRR